MKRCPFSLDPQIGPQQLLQILDRLVQTWAKNLRVKLLITCVTTVWDLYPTQDLVSWPLYFTKVLDKPLIVERFNHREFREGYRNYLGIHPDQDEDRFERVERICEGDPFVLKLISEPELRAEALEGELSTAMVLDGYYQQRILEKGLGPEKDGFLALFVERLLEEGREDIPEARVIGIQDAAHQALQEEGILIVNHPQETVQLHHTRLTEYLIGRYFGEEYPDGIDQEELYGLIQKAAPGFHALWQAIAGYLARWGTMDLFMQVARSDEYEHQEMVVDALEIAGRTRARPEREIQNILGELLRDEARQSKAVALRAAVRLRQMGSVLEEALDWITEDPTVAAEYVYLSWREVKETRLGYGIWDDVAGVVEEAWGRFSRRSEEFKYLESVFDFLLSFTWRILVNECYDRTTIQRMSTILGDMRQRSQRLSGRGWCGGVLKERSLRPQNGE